MNFAASKDIIQNTPFPYNSMDRLRLAQQMTQAPQVSQEVQGQGGLAGLPVVQAGFGGFLRKIAPIALAIAAPYALPYIAPGLAGTALGTGLAVGAGSGLGSLIAGAKPKDALKTALLSGVTAGAMKGASNYFSGVGTGTEGLDPNTRFQLTGADGKPLSTSETFIQQGFSEPTGGMSDLAYKPDVSFNQSQFLDPIKPEYGGPIDISKITPNYNMGTGIASDSVAASNLDAYQSNIDAFTQSQPEIIETAYTDYRVPREFNVRVDPSQQVPIVGETGTYTAGGDFQLYKQPGLEGQGTLQMPTVQEAMNIQPQLNPLQQFVSDVKTNPVQMLSKAAVIDMTQPDFERMYAMEELSQQEQDLMAGYPTATISGYGTKKVVNTPMGAIPYTSDTAALQRALDEAYGRTPRTRQIATKQYQDINTAAEGGLITAARGGMFAAPGEFSGMVPGQGGGQDDNVFMPIVENGQQKATLAVSPSEYVVDSYTMAALGDGNPAQGAKVMDQVVEEVREEAYGTDKQPNATKGLSTLRSLMT